MQPRLTKTHYHCRKCNTWKVVESLGEVLSGPVCVVCKKPMRRVKLEQTDLGLLKKK